MTHAPALDVVIVDDEPAARRTLRECCAREPDLAVVGEFGDTRSALEAIRARPPQVLFLDIHIDASTGLEIARSLEPASLPAVVFVTAYDRHALEAFDLSAVDYLLKPFDDERFQRTLTRVRQRCRTQGLAERQLALAAVLDELDRRVRPAASGGARIAVEQGSRTHVLDVSRVELIEADRNYVKITVGRDVFSARSTLQQAERSLLSQPMLKISRSCLVNMSHVREISRTARGDAILVLAGGATVTSSEGYREAVRRYLDGMRFKTE